MELKLQILSDAEKEQVHERTLGVLARAGMRCDTVEGRRILAAAGARVDEATHVVRFPRELVERSLAAATTQPPRDYVFGRELGRGEPWLPGDIIQFSSCHFVDCSASQTHYL